MKEDIKKKQENLVDELAEQLSRMIYHQRVGSLGKGFVEEETKNKIRKTFDKVRKETAEAVCDKMIGKVLKNDIMSWNDRVITEQIIKKQIIESL